MRPAELAGMIAAGVPLGVALEPNQKSHWLVDLAIKVGAPLVPALRNLEQQLQSQERISSEVSQAQAVPKATRKLLLWLPAVTVLLGEAMGLGTLVGLFTPLGFLALALAILILWFGSKVSGRMLQNLKEPDTSASEQLLALDLCLAAGVRLNEIQSVLGVELGPKANSLLAVSQNTGASLRPLIAAEVERINLELLNDQLAKAKKLSVALLIPLSLTTLPAFLLLTIPPMLIGITQ